MTLFAKNDGAIGRVKEMKKIIVFIVGLFFPFSSYGYKVEYKLSFHLDGKEGKIGGLYGHSPYQSVVPPFILNSEKEREHVKLKLPLFDPINLFAKVKMYVDDVLQSQKTWNLEELNDFTENDRNEIIKKIFLMPNKISFFPEGTSLWMRRVQGI